MKNKDVQGSVKKHLLKHGTITPLQCIYLYGGLRLADVVRRLKKAPHNMNIKTIMMDQKNSSSKYAKYQLVK